MVAKEHTEHWHRAQTAANYKEVFEKAVEFMRNNCNMTVVIDDFVFSSGYSRRTVQRSFSFHGTTWREKLYAVRIEQASDLLRNTEKSMRLIAREVGYRNATRLNRAFRNYCGLSPTAYRRESREHE